MPVMRRCLFGEDVIKWREKLIDLVAREGTDGAEKSILLKTADVVW